MDLFNILDLWAPFYHDEQTFPILESLQISIPASSDPIRIYASRTPIYITAIRETQEIEP
jgi:hypothetical protein